MDMLWHDHVSDYVKAKSATHFFQQLQEYVASTSCPQERLTSITTRGNEMQVALTIKSTQATAAQLDHEAAL